jgi:rod shape determining protein RodA
MRDFGGTVAEPRLTLAGKLWNIDWLLVSLLGLLAGMGVLMLYSAAEGRLEPWAGRQIVRFGAGAVTMIAVALVDIRFWLRWAYLIYAVAIVLLAAVDIMGVIGMGARRWLMLGPLSLQPSEIMKIALVLALARYFHFRGEEQVNRFLVLMVALAMVLIPVALVLEQPDLGTAVMILASATVLFFVAGVAWWKFLVAGALAGAALPIGWQMLHDYQRQRVLTFLDPERDPLGAGYHILQSKIALGSGGIFGKGLMQGTQSQLNFLPEKHTDFIFTMLAEELGMAGCLFLLGLYAIILLLSLGIALRCTNQFGRLLAIGISATFFSYAFINMAMVMGLIPVVGVPLPLVSYGGTAMTTLLIGFGLVLSASVHRDLRIGRGPGIPD